MTLEEKQKQMKERQLIKQLSNKYRLYDQSLNPYDTVPGYVYFIHCQGYVKIGHAIHPENRISNIQTSNPFRVSKLLLIKTNNMIALERMLQERFKHLWKSGEWFSLKDSLLEFLMQNGVKISVIDGKPVFSSSEISIEL